MTEKQTIDYTAILADLETKKTALEAAIFSLKSAISLGALGQANDSAGFASLGGNVAIAGQSMELPAGAFLGKSVPEAIKLYLSVVKKKKTSREIAEALKEGGIESTSDDFVGIVTTILTRLRKNGEVLRFKEGGWGLAEWYPAGFRSATGNNIKPKTRKKAKVTAKSTTKETKKEKQTEKKEESTSMKERLLSLIQSRGGECSFQEIVEALNSTETKIAPMLLGQLISAHKLEKTDSGSYRIATVN